MSDIQQQGLSEAELMAEGATALPDKEVVSILDLNADVDLAIDAAAPIDLAVAANLNVAAPIDAAVGANILSEGSTAQALSDQGVIINQGIDADAVATSEQDSTIDQGNDVIDEGTTPATGGRGRLPRACHGAVGRRDRHHRRSRLDRPAPRRRHRRGRRCCRSRHRHRGRCGRR